MKSITRNGTKMSHLLTFMNLWLCRQHSKNIWCRN